MTSRAVLRSAVAFAAFLLVSMAGHAQLFRAYLDPSGNDGNPCTLPAPCRLLPAALNAVADGGEIWMLDSANYNTATVTIGKSVSILAVPGAVGSILAIGGPAVNITAAGMRVALRNVVIVPLTGGGGTQGVAMSGASDLTIENSLIANLPGAGVSVTGGGLLRIADTVIRNVAGNAVQLDDGPRATIAGTKLLANGGGVVVVSNMVTETQASVTDCVIANLPAVTDNVGVFAYAGAAGAAARAQVTRCTIERARYGVAANASVAGSTAEVTVSYSAIVNNQDGIKVTNATGTAVVYSLGNNHVAGNGSSEAPTPMALQ